MSAQAPCWAETGFLQVVRQDAEDVPDHIFRAVHSATELQLKESFDGTPSPVEAHTVIERFLEPGRDYVQFVVLGQAGTGKSHLIQWLRLNLPRDPRDLVLTIPRAGTSLRGIVERIIDSLPDAESEPFREKLKTAGTQAATTPARIDKLLDSLAWSIRHGGVAAASDEVLAETLPDLLRDPNLRRDFFARPDGTIARLVAHVFVDPRSRDDQESRREFTAGDIPLDPQYFAGVGALAKDAIDIIADEAGLEERAIALMTRALEPAIAQTMNFTADDLIGLMTALRSHLAHDGRRLILLIEDFARLQGIDTALLQALITPPHQEGQRLCELRWAMAVTSGYFDRLEDTVKQRTTFMVDMDASRPASVHEFAAGYLNAVRVGADALLAAGAGPVPNACSACPRREPCWEAFGTAADIGLFPFNRTALEQLATRGEALADGAFNPRRFLKRVLEPVLHRGYADLERGTFPPKELLERAGGALTPARVLNVQRADSRDAERRVTLLELWDGSGRVVNLPHGVHEAFGIPELPDIGRVEHAEPPAPDHDGAAATARPMQNEPPLVAAIRAWASDEDARLVQNHVNRLRDLVFAALEAFIDWDALAYQKNQVCQAVGSAPFTKTSINFARQQTERMSRRVTIELPLSGRLRETAVALEALVRAEDTCGWDVENGTEVLAYLVNELRLWADEITRQLDALTAAQGEWDPIAACTELLVLAAYQSRRIKPDDTAEEIAVKLFEAAECEPSPGATQAFADANNRLVRAWKPAQDVLRALCAGTKGGVVKTFFLRAAPVLSAIRALRKRRFRFAGEPPEALLAAARAPSNDVFGRMAAVAAAYRETKNRYSEAIEGERAAWTAWCDGVRGALGAETKISRFAAALGEAIGDAEAIGLGGGVTPLRDRLQALEPRRCDAALDHAAALADAYDGEAAFRAASAALLRPQIDALLSKTHEFVERLENKIAAERAQTELMMGPGLENSKTEIGTALDRLVASMEAFA